MAVLSVGRADNWLVDTGTDPSEHGGLSAFGKVRLEKQNISDQYNAYLFPHTVTLPNLFRNLANQFNLQVQGLNNVL